MIPRTLHRPRRLRRTETIRRLVRETDLPPGRLVLPIFIVEGENQRQPIDGMEGVSRYSIDEAIRFAGGACGMGVCSFALFPKVPDEQKTADGSAAVREDSLACRSLRALKDALPEACLIADVALDPFSSDGHDGIVAGGRILNDETVEILAEMAVVQARAGADIIAPSDMMDGRVGAIRHALDGAALHDTIILSYAAKYASSFYGPFRGALGSAPVERSDVPKDKATYQMDPANAIEASREAGLDADEAADMLMVKPGLPYLDIIARLAAEHEVPIAAYHVSGEYAMLRAAASQGLMDYEAGLVESLVCLARAGARVVLTYGALDYAAWWRREHGLA
jgi:porphobilinogen synthase